ncbi:MAG: site-specific DNA-methyltransferase [Clostridia bacterium]|nr:site-specific DNA-methyltransferase [Clostridia bacterium]
MFEALNGIRGEVRPGQGSGLMLVGDAAEESRRLALERPDSVSLIYMDPPFGTGQQFTARLRVGEKQWKTGQGSITVPSYKDALDGESYMELMRRVLEASRTLLTDDGLVFIHLDWRMNAPVRLLADEVFGEKNFINEIVWVYETGGRSKRFFSRKHDVILLYAKDAAYDLHIEDVAAPRPGGPGNHMKKHVDEDGRVYRTITSGGKVYRYYDDEPVPPSDVWTDVSHLQQKDPQRQGYDTQKPLALLERIVKCASRPGDTVMDPFCGSGTLLEAAFRLGRGFIGIDSNPMCAEYARRRTQDGQLCVFYPPRSSSARLSAQAVSGITSRAVYLNEFVPEEGLPPEALRGFDAVDSWAVGTVKDGVFYTLDEEIRSFRTPGLKGELYAPMGDEPLAVRVSDVLGRRSFFLLDNEGGSVS